MRYETDLKLLNYGLSVFSPLVSSSFVQTCVKQVGRTRLKPWFHAKIILKNFRPDPPPSVARPKSFRAHRPYYVRICGLLLPTE